MAETEKTVTLMLPCPKCGEAVELQQTIEFEKLETFQLEDDKVRMLYKTKSSIATEVHLCTGEKKPATGGPITVEEARKFWARPLRSESTGTSYTITNGEKLMAAAAATPQAETYRALIIASTHAEANRFLERNRRAFDGWDVKQHRWDQDPTRLRGMQVHLTIFIGEGAPPELREEVACIARLGVNPRIVTAWDEKSIVDPNAEIRPRIDPIEGLDF